MLAAKSSCTRVPPSCQSVQPRNLETGWGDREPLVVKLKGVSTQQTRELHATPTTSNSIAWKPTVTSCAKNLSPTSVPTASKPPLAAFGCSRNTVRKWLCRYRPGMPSSLRLISLGRVW